MEKKHGCGCFVLSCFVIIVVIFGSISLIVSPKHEEDARKDSEQKAADISETNDASKSERFEPATYEAAYNYIKAAEEAIKKNNGLDFNRYGESGAEKIIYSDEYSGLYCALWSAMEEVGTPGDSRFKKMKLRWQADYTNKKYKKRLINAYKKGGEEAMLNLYGDIYQQEVFPAVNDRWKNE